MQAIKCGEKYIKVEKYSDRIIETKNPVLYKDAEAKVKELTESIAKSITWYGDHVVKAQKDKESLGKRLVKQQAKMEDLVQQPYIEVVDAVTKLTRQISNTEMNARFATNDVVEYNKTIKRLSRIQDTGFKIIALAE
jgi:predicted  nucleic acid-binding Zn-ribbon protein